MAALDSHHSAPFAISLSLPSGSGGLDITRLLAGSLVSSGMCRLRLMTERGGR